MPITDRVCFAGRSLDLVRIDGPPLFDPRDAGIQVSTGFSLCPRGWYAVWTLDGGLRLDTLHVKPTDDAVLPRLSGVRPIRGTRRTHRLVGNRWMAGEWPSWDHVYTGLGVETRFTGSLWLAGDRVGSPSADEPLLGYRTVWDILVNDGRMTAAIDRSPEVAGARARRRARPEGQALAFNRLH